MRQGVEMTMTQSLLISIMFGTLIGVAIEFLNRLQIRSLYAALLLSSNKQNLSSVKRESLFNRTNITRCFILSLLLSILAYGSIKKIDLFVIIMMLVIFFYFYYVSRLEIKSLRQITKEE